MIVERELPPRALGPEGQAPVVIATQRVRLTCGCAVWIGRRTDDGDVATVAQPCCLEHRRGVITRFNTAMSATLPSQSTEPLIEVVARVFQEAEDAG